MGRIRKICVIGWLRTKGENSMTTIQKIALSIAVLGFLAGATTQLTDILSPFGSMAPVIVKELVSLSGLVSGILGVILSFMTGQSQQIKSVQQMPGVEKIVINEKASPALATMAVDPAQAKIETMPAAKSAVAATARAAE